MAPDNPNHYSAAQDDLYNPGRRDEFFLCGRPTSDAVLCVEMARLAYCRVEPDFGLDQNRIKGILKPVGFTDCKFFESQGKPQGEGVHCFLALGDGAQKNPNEKMAVVAFRGTDAKDISDVAYDTDFKLEPWTKGSKVGNVHAGFDHALDQVLPQLSPALQAIGNHRMLFAGHSLGAALATLLASVCKPDGLYTFGSPRVGDAAFVASLNDVNRHRYVDCCDLVARIPLEIMGYVHLGDPYYIDRNGHITFNPQDDFMQGDRLHAEVEYLENYAWKLGNVAVRDLADHAPINYVWAVTADQP